MIFRIQMERIVANFGPLYAQYILFLRQNARTRCLAVESIRWR